MKKRVGKRPYRMRARAEAAAQTARDILSATVELWHERSLDEVTLQEIADRAGVSVQTVLRRFGSKEGVSEACIEADPGNVRAGRNAAPVGDVERALDIVLEHYERDGDAILRTLALEAQMEAAKAIVERGRSEHREWCARVFAPYLPAPDSGAFDTRLDAFVAATDLYLWKLFRRDRGRSAADTRRVVGTLLQGLIQLPLPQP